MKPFVVITAHILARLLMAAVLFMLLLRDGGIAASRPAPKPIIEPTSNLDLQLARLYVRAEGGWTETQRRELGDLLTARGEFERAARLALSAPPAPDSLPALLQAGREQAAAGDWTAAQATFERVLALDPANQQANWSLGLLQIPAGDPLPYLQHAAMVAGDQRAAVVLGIVQVAGYTPRDVALRLLEFGEYAHAERLLTLQIERDNLDALAFAYRGLARDQLGRNGLADIEQALALEPASPIPFFVLGLHYRAQEQFDLSLEAFLDAYLLDTQNPALAAEVAAAYQLNDDLALAEEWYRLAVSSASGDARFAGLLAAFYADTEYQLESHGTAFVAQAVEDYPGDAALLAHWGRVQFHLTRFEAAEETLRQALALAPDDLRIRYYLAEALERQNKRTQALELYFELTRTENPYREAAQRGVLRLSQ